MNEELYLIEAPYFLTNDKRTKLFICLPTSQQSLSVNEFRILIPIQFENAVIEKYNPQTSSYVPDNLSTIEFHAKQKGLV
jgi:hypothetical protein